jgi:hypothetical protein
MKILKSLLRKSSTKIRAEVIQENSSLDIPLPSQLELYDGKYYGNFILRRYEDFQRAALKILRSRASDGSFYPTYEELDQDRQLAFKKLVEIYGTVTPDETKGLSSKESIKALSDYFNRKTIATELEKAYHEDIQFVEDLNSILAYSDEEIEKNIEIWEYVHQMAAYLLFARQNFPKEGFTFEELSLDDLIEYS